MCLLYLLSFCTLSISTNRIYTLYVSHTQLKTINIVNIFKCENIIIEIPKGKIKSYFYILAFMVSTKEKMFLALV